LRDGMHAPKLSNTTHLLEEKRGRLAKSKKEGSKATSSLKWGRMVGTIAGEKQIKNGSERSHASNRETQKLRSITGK